MHKNSKKYQNNLRKTWDTLKGILNKMKSKSDPIFKENKILKIRDTFNLNCLKLYYHKNQGLQNFLMTFSRQMPISILVILAEEMTFKIFHVMLK